MSKRRPPDNPRRGTPLFSDRNNPFLHPDDPQAREAIRRSIKSGVNTTQSPQTTKEMKRTENSKKEIRRSYFAYILLAMAIIYVLASYRDTVGEIIDIPSDLISGLQAAFDNEYYLEEGELMSYQQAFRMMRNASLEGDNLVLPAVVYENYSVDLSVNNQFDYDGQGRHDQYILKSLLDRLLKESNTPTTTRIIMGGDNPYGLAYQAWSVETIGEQQVSVKTVDVPAIKALEADGNRMQVMVIYKAITPDGIVNIPVPVYMLGGELNITVNPNAQVDVPTYSFAVINKTQPPVFEDGVIAFIENNGLVLAVLVSN